MEIHETMTLSLLLGWFFFHLNWEGSDTQNTKNYLSISEGL